MKLSKEQEEKVIKVKIAIRQLEDDMENDEAIEKLYNAIKSLEFSLRYEYVKQL